MNLSRHSPLSIILFLTTPGFLVPAKAFPPAPGIVVSGTIRDEIGRPIDAPNAFVIFRSGERVLKSGKIDINLGDSKNYRVLLPVDMNPLKGAYRSGVLNESLPFSIQVRIGDEVLQPIESAIGLETPGKPGSLVRLDLNLGADSDGDGLPDSWEYRQLALGGLSRDDPGYHLDRISPDGDADGDGRSNWDEYLAGTLAFVQSEIPELKIVKRHADGWIEIEFEIQLDKAYLFEAANDLKEWLPVAAAIDGDRLTLQSSFRAQNSRRLTVHLPPADVDGARFYRVRVQ